MGFPIPEVDVYVVHEGALCKTDEPGELLHGEALLESGYWNAPEETAEKIRPEACLRDLIGDAPVLHTGDIVRREADGCLWYVGRSERMIKSSGFRFGPSEIEDVLRADHSVRDVVVFGPRNERLRGGGARGRRDHRARVVASRGGCRTPVGSASTSSPPTTIARSAMRRSQRSSHDHVLRRRNDRGSGGTSAGRDGIQRLLLH